MISVSDKCIDISAFDLEKLKP